MLPRLMKGHFFWVDYQVGLRNKDCVSHALGRSGIKAISGMYEPGTFHGPGLIYSFPLFPFFIPLHLGFKFLGEQGKLIRSCPILIMGRQAWLIGPPKSCRTVREKFPFG